MNEQTKNMSMNEQEHSASASVQDIRSELRQVRSAFRRADVLLARAEKYREMAVRATGRVDAVRLSGTPQRSRVEDCVLELVDTHNALQKEIGQLLARSREAEKRILMLADERQRAVLQLRYLCAMSWEDVAERLHYTLRWVHKVHREALEALAQTWVM